MASERTAPARAAVALARCAGYGPQEVGRAAAQVLTALEPLDLPRGGRVLLKPNCLSSHHGPDSPVNTRAEVVEAVGRYLVDNHGLRLVIADSGGLSSYGRTKKSYRLMGFDQVADNLGADLVNLEELGLIEYRSPIGRVVDRFQATQLLDQVQAIVNLPKLKTHLLTGMTGAVKNCFGLLPGSLKRDVHVIALNPSLMAQALVDIYAAFKAKPGISLHLMDAVVAMEGTGPAQGQARPAGWLLGSADGVALDCLAATMMGFNPAKVETVALAAGAGLGQGRLETIDLLGAGSGDLKLPGFKRPFGGLKTLLGGFFPAGLAGRAFGWLNEAKPWLAPENCQLCGLCVEACPAGALSLDQGRLDLDRDKCIECYCCLEHCPSQGLWVPRGLWDRLRGRPRAGL